MVDLDTAGGHHAALRFARTKARRAFAAQKSAAKVPDIRFHDMRHTFATLMLRNRADLNTVSRMLGHSSVKITLDVYGHVVPGMQKRP